MKSISLSLLTIAAISWIGCNTNPSAENKTMTHQEQPEVHDHEHSYACPMHPEVTGHEGDKCTKCGMDLVHIDKEAATKEFMMMMKAEPAQLSAQKPGALFFMPMVKGKDSEKVPLDVVHDKKIHLIVVSNDLSYFDHVHPEFQADGNYKIEVSDKKGVENGGMGHSTTQFPNGGEYTLYADYLPAGASHQVEKIPVHVEGGTVAQKTWTRENLVSTDKEFTLTLKPSGGKFFTKQTMHIDAPLTINGKAIKTGELDDFLGAKAHMVVIGVNDMSYLHVHPEEHDGVLDLHADFENPGFYRGWIQFKYKGQLHTMSFVIEVVEGTGAQTTEGAHSNGHGQGDEHKH